MVYRCFDLKPDMELRINYREERVGGSKINRGGVGGEELKRRLGKGSGD